MIAMNAVYLDEIGKRLSALGLGAAKVVGGERRACPACGAAASEPFLALRGVPVNPSQRSSTRAQARRVTVRDVCSRSATAAR